MTFTHQFESNSYDWRTDRQDHSGKIPSNATSFNLPRFEEGVFHVQEVISVDCVDDGAVGQTYHHHHWEVI